MFDINYNIYNLINFYFIQKNKLQHVLIKECKIFTYNNYSGKEVDAVVKLTINIEEIVRDRFIYKMF